MTKILFLDDDAIARQNIKKRINWSSHQWELIYTAKDGVDALDFIQNHQPNIILSDIKMPVMDGIEFATIAKNYYPDIKFIFISGYRDFEYAKQALKLNAVDFITKPYDNDTLISVLSKAEQQYLEDKKNSQIIHIKYPLIRRQYISRLLSENFKNIDDRILRAFDINLNNGFGIVGFIDYPKDFSDDPCFFHRLSEELCGQLSKQWEGSLFFPMEQGQIFMIFTCNNLTDEADFLCRLQSMEATIHLFLQSHIHNKGRFCYGSVMRKLGDLYSSFQTAQQKFNEDATDLLFKVRSYLEKNFSDPTLSLTTVADFFSINHCYLTTIFKDKFSINLYDYLIQLRMKQAGELALSSSMKIYEIAEASGYQNSQYFSISFKKYYGCTLTEFRKKIRP